MKKMVILLSLLFLVGIAANALSVCDYSAPETALTDARLSLGIGTTMTRIHLGLWM